MFLYLVPNCRIVSFIDSLFTEIKMCFSFKKSWVLFKTIYAKIYSTNNKKYNNCFENSYFFEHMSCLEAFSPHLLYTKLLFQVCILCFNVVVKSKKNLVVKS